MILSESLRQLAVTIENGAAIDPESLRLLAQRAKGLEYTLAEIARNYDEDVLRAIDRRLLRDREVSAGRVVALDARRPMQRPSFGVVMGGIA